jgi:broad-specificity NMP kinase
MTTFIFITGAPGSGKSTTAVILQRRLGTPLFEFGWIPEFRNTGTRITSFEEDEALALENRTLVLRSSGYRNWQEAVTINRRLLDRPTFPNEHFIDVSTEPADEVVNRIPGLT